MNPCQATHDVAPICTFLFYTQSEMFDTSDLSVIHCELMVPLPSPLANGSDHLPAGEDGLNVSWNVDPPDKAMALFLAAFCLGERQFQPI